MQSLIYHPQKENKKPSWDPKTTTAKVVNINAVNKRAVGEVGVAKVGVVVKNNT